LVNGQVCKWTKQGWRCTVLAVTACNEDLGVKREQNTDTEEASGIKPFKKGKTQASDSAAQVKEVKSHKSYFKKKHTPQPVGTIDSGKPTTVQTSQTTNPKIRSAGIEPSPETHITNTKVPPASDQKPITETSISSSAARLTNGPDMSEFEVALEAVVIGLKTFRKALSQQEESVERLFGCVGATPERQG
jgi:hypothetical protein